MVNLFLRLSPLAITNGCLLQEKGPKEEAVRFLTSSFYFVQDGELVVNETPISSFSALPSCNYQWPSFARGRA